MYTTISKIESDRARAADLVATLGSDAKLLARAVLDLVRSPHDQKGVAMMTMALWIARPSGDEEPITPEVIRGRATVLDVRILEMWALVKRVENLAGECPKSARCDSWVVAIAESIVQSEQAACRAIEAGHVGAPVREAERAELAKLLDAAEPEPKVMGAVSACSDALAVARGKHDSEVAAIVAEALRDNGVSSMTGRNLRQYRITLSGEQWDRLTLARDTLSDAYAAAASATTGVPA